MKTKSFKILFAAIVLFFLQGCRGDNTPDELSGNYFVRHEGELMNHLPNKKEIFGRVIKYDYNSNFIIALQHPDYKDYVSMIAFNLRDDIKKYPQNSEKDIETTELLADSILKHNPYYKSIFVNNTNYWIIDIRTDSLYGPLNKAAYDTKRIVLHIPDNVNLN